MNNYAVAVEPVEPSVRIDAHRALLADVVLLAVKDALGISRIEGISKDLAKRRALSWINNPSAEKFSFNWYCHWIDIDADAARKRVNSSPDTLLKAVMALPESRQGVYPRKHCARIS